MKVNIITYYEELANSITETEKYTICRLQAGAPGNPVV